MKHSFAISVVLMVILSWGCTQKTSTQKATEEKTEQMTEVNLFETITYEDRVSVTLTNETPDAFAETFSAYDMAMLHRISRSKFTYSFTFNPKKISLDDMIILCEKEDDVISANKLTYTSKKKK